MMAAIQTGVRRNQLVGVLLLLFLVACPAFARAQVVVDFEKAEITGRWVDSWEEKGVVFTPAHAPTRSKAKAKLMFFPHLSSGRKGILSAMADDPIPVRARFPAGASSVTIVFWASTGCPARLVAYDANGKPVDEAALDAAPSRKAPGDPVPTFELTVKGSNIAYVEFSGPRAGEYLAADEVRFRPVGAARSSRAVSSAGLPCNSDHLRFTANGQREFGKRYAEKLLSLPEYQIAESK